MKYFLFLALLFVIPVNNGCALHTPDSLTTEQARRAYPALQIAIRVNQLQATVIQAEASNALDTRVAAIIIKFTVSANKILADVPNGWLQSVTKEWTEMKDKIRTDNSVIITAMGVVDVALGLVAPQ